MDGLLPGIFFGSRVWRLRLVDVLFVVHGIARTRDVGRGGLKGDIDTSRDGGI